MLVSALLLINNVVVVVVVDVDVDVLRL